MKFTSLQLGFLAKNFFKEEKLTIQQWADIANVVKEFISLGDPYDIPLVQSAVEFVLKDSLPTEKSLAYFIGKVVYWEESK